MGMFDNVVLLDEPLACPAGHPIGDLQTKSFCDPSMSTYLIRKGSVVRAASRSWRDESGEEARSAWRIAVDAAVHETRYRLEPVSPPAEVRVYSHCALCEPVLVRTDRPSFWGDIVQEHRLFVEFSLQFPEDQEIPVKRVSGGREDVMEELRRAGLHVLSDDAPLAVAHREIQRARRSSRAGSPIGGIDAQKPSRKRQEEVLHGFMVLVLHLRDTRDRSLPRRAMRRAGR